MVLWRIHFHRIEIEKRYRRRAETGFLKMRASLFERKLVVLPSLQMFVFFLTSVLFLVIPTLFFEPLHFFVLCFLRGFVGVSR